ncbi:hypothetical protein KTR66_03675 [Roseococcus sp. SDR]|uniref:hypothetical protein n=1 Tax=Roseococcus sp. SDR TaxID=2835532 RepID=UPI001BD0AA1C|nr:hypothetical protein [Roseococcus sp. SDR]MBS7789079.1 hypothetical protein [Roseococcus sp. SDR]MBV1844393.1 hypothetical protein [Roseococcus sp. SDR]
MTLHPDTLLIRKAAAEALTAAGFLIKPATLATKATRGGGPPFRTFNGRALYRWSDLLEWAERTASARCASTAERDARRAA